MSFWVIVALKWCLFLLQWLFPMSYISILGLGHWLSCWWIVYQYLQCRAGSDILQPAKSLPVILFTVHKFQVDRLSWNQFQISITGVFSNYTLRSTHPCQVGCNWSWEGEIHLAESSECSVWSSALPWELPVSCLARKVSPYWHISEVQVAGLHHFQAVHGCSHDYQRVPASHPPPWLSCQEGWRCRVAGWAAGDLSHMQSWWCEVCQSLEGLGYPGLVLATLQLG